MIKKEKKSEPSNEILSALSSFHLEANRHGGGMSLVLSGVIGVSDFTDEVITLLSHRGRVCVKGSKLFISLYENHCIEIEGRINEITFNYGKN